MQFKRGHPETVDNSQQKSHANLVSTVLISTKNHSTITKTRSEMSTQKN